MYNQPVEWDKDPSEWTYAPIRFWPGKVDGTDYGKISFFAWNADTGAEVSASNVPGTPTLTYTVLNDYRDQKDLVADVLTDKTVNDSKVRFAFSHILSRIGFTASLKEVYPATTVTVTSLIVRYADNAVKSTGIYTFGDGDHAEGTWQLSDTYMSGTSGELVKAGGVLLDNTATLQTARVNSDNSYLMLLPQPITAEAVYIDVSWMVDGIVHTKTLPLPAGVWEQGKRYDYNIRVSLTGITLDPVTVNDWEADAPKKLYTITYKANDGAGEDVVQPCVIGGTSQLWDASTFTPPAPGYAFTGWNTQVDGLGYNYMPGDQIPATGDLTLYAQWERRDNCHMVVPGEPVTFSVARTYVDDGNGNSVLYTGTFSAEVLWADVVGLIDGTPSVTGSGIDAKVTVQTAGTTPGNAVVAIKKAGSEEIVWSYHIWVTGYNPKTENTTNTQNGLTFMSRNLGAMADDLSAAAYGLYYQWGRKDPFPGVDNPGGGDNTITLIDTSSSVGTVSYSIQHPATFIFASANPWDWHHGSRNDALWGQGTDKSVYDPCPSGWRVPEFTDGNSPWKGFTVDNGAWSGSGDGGRDWSSADNLLSPKQYGAYPASGYRHDISGVIDKTGSNGVCWSTAVKGTDGYYLAFNSTGVSSSGFYSRASGFNVRCVSE
jgi:uncharacterized repeat protein (TIGR02543 family)